MHERISFNELPEAVAYLIKMVAELKTIVEKNKSSTLPVKREPLDIDQASRMIKKAKPTIYAMVRRGILPGYKRGKKLFFFEDELMQWIELGKKKTIQELRNEMEADMLKLHRYRRR